MIGLTKDVLERDDEMTDRALAKIGEVVKSIIDEFQKNTIPLEFVKIDSYSLSIKLFINSAPSWSSLILSIKIFL